MAIETRVHNLWVRVSLQFSHHNMHSLTKVSHMLVLFSLSPVPKCIHLEVLNLTHL